MLYREDYELLKLTHPDLPQLMRHTNRQRSYERLSPFLRRPKFFLGLSVDLTRSILGALSKMSELAREDEAPRDASDAEDDVELVFPRGPTGGWPAGEEPWWEREAPLVCQVEVA